MAPVPIELPKPGLEGTPPNFNIPNLEKPSAKPRPPFLAPEGVTNVAKGKTVTSSEKEPLVGDLTMITDGDTEQVEGNDVELGPGVQWVVIDLAEPQEIYGILMWHYFQPRVYYCRGGADRRRCRLQTKLADVVQQRHREQGWTGRR